MPLRKDRHHESALNSPRVLLLNTESQSCGALSFGRDPNEARTLYLNLEEIKKSSNATAPYLSAFEAALSWRGLSSL